MFNFVCISRDYQVEYEKLRDEKLNATATKTKDKLEQIQKQGPGSVVTLNSNLITEVKLIIF